MSRTAVRGATCQRSAKGCVLRGVLGQVVVAETVPAAVGRVDRMTGVRGEHVVEQCRRHAGRRGHPFGGHGGEHRRPGPGGEPTGPQVGVALGDERLPAGLGLRVVDRGEYREQSVEGVHPAFAALGVADVKHGGRAAQHRLETVGADRDAQQAAGVRYLPPAGHGEPAAPEQADVVLAQQRVEHPDEDLLLAVVGHPVIVQLRSSRNAVSAARTVSGSGPMPCSAAR
ncbi:hypothetical protein [Micromonospora sp. WMMB235]|uniref:hypothetical protein n=1 Tax=Micromonospora sp. WMMB235 TaxID=1172030 RepID=UPI002100B6EB|nr:hypothetical protein [Micromonospora sp. WMMB235]